MKWILAFLLLTSTLQAQPPLWSHAVLIGGAGLDLLTTRIAIHHGATETGSAGNGIKPQIGVLTLHVGVVEALSYAAARSGHPTIARNNLLIHGLFHVGLAVWNTRVIREKGNR